MCVCVCVFLDYNLRGYDAMQLCWWLPTFWKDVTSIFTSNPTPLCYVLFVHHKSHLSSGAGDVTIAPTGGELCARYWGVTHEELLHWCEALGHKLCTPSRRDTCDW